VENVDVRHFSLIVILRATLASTAITTYPGMEKRMVRTLLGSFAFVLVIGSLAGCYRTSVRAVQTQPSGPEIEDRQWFTVGGLVRLSEPAGAECGASGLAYAESRMGGMDILINVGLALGGSILGTAICDSEGDAMAYASCVQGTTTLVPFLFSTRTVTYACGAPGGVIGDLPRIPSPKTKTADAETDQE
jgi:hypothetical protein